MHPLQEDDFSLEEILQEFGLSLIHIFQQSLRNIIAGQGVGFGLIGIVFHDALLMEICPWSGWQSPGFGHRQGKSDQFVTIIAKKAQRNNYTL